MYKKNFVDEEKVIELAKAKWTTKEIANHLGCTRQHIEHLRRKHNVKASDNIPKYTCRICGETDKSKFYKTYVYICGKCQNEKTKKSLANVKSEMIKYKGSKCQICGYDKCDSALEFHHIDPKQKDSSITNMIQTRVELNILIKEVDKCILICANCHRELHKGLITI